MIKTFSTSNDAPIKTGLIQVQSALPSSANSNTGTSSKNTKNQPQEIPLSGVGAVITDADSIKNVANPSLETLATVAGDPEVILPTIGGAGSKLLPSYNLDIHPSVVLPESSDDLAVTTKKFEPYELRTGISHERPEIVMLTNFLPLYQRNVSTGNNSLLKHVSKVRRPELTDAGEFFDTQTDIRSIRAHQVKQLITEVKQNFTSFRNVTQDRSSAMSQALIDLETTSLFLWSVMRSIEKLKQQLDLRDDVHSVDPYETLRTHLSVYGSAKANGVLEFLGPSVTSYFPSQYDIPYVMSLFGYVENNSRYVYSSSKLWMQMMLEYKHCLQTHSLSMLDIDPNSQRNDKSPVAITQTRDTKRFDYTAIVPSLPTLDSIKSMTPGIIYQYVNAVVSSYNTIYQGVPFKHREMQLACLINAISREHRYSLGLTKPEVQRSLQEYYGYQISDVSNLRLFDSVIGQFGSNITDFPAFQTKTLTSLAQQQVSQNVAVLPFESRYVEGDTGTLTPGSSYYVDPVLSTTSDGRFNVERLNSLQGTIQNALSNFNVIVDGMNLLQSEYVDVYSLESGQFATSIANPVSLFEAVRNQLMTSDGVGLLPILADDPLIPVFAAAHSDVKLRSLLLLYVVTKMSKAYTHNVEFFVAGLEQDNTPTSDELVKLIVQHLLVTTKHTSTTYLGKTDDYDKNTGAQYNGAKDQRTINIDSVTTSLKNNGSRFINLVASIMGSMLATFKKNNGVFNGSKTRYGGHTDTVVFMSMLDMITSFIDLYGNRHIVGQYVDKAQTKLIVDAHHVSHGDSINEVNQRLGREIMLTEAVSFAVMNSLSKMVNSINNVINYLNSPESIDELRKISSLLSEPGMLHMLLSEQQIRLLASTVADLRSALNGHSRTGNEPGDIDGDGEFDADDELLALDDAEITPKVRQAIDDMLSMDEFTQSSAASRKILTVGIPLGFSRYLQQKVDIKKLKRTSFDVRQNDIINIAVYKVDMQNPDIVYRPQRFMFELSRFPVRNDYFIKDIPGSSKLNIASRFPTRDSNQAFSSGGTMQYLRSTGGDIQAFDTDDYDFLTREQKDNLYINHVMSYLLEVYLRTMTGVSTADYHFDIVDPPAQVDSAFSNMLLNHYVNHVDDVRQKQTTTEQVGNGGIFFSAAHAAKKGGSNGKYTSQDAAGGSQRYLANSAGISGMSTSHSLSGFSDPSPTKVTAQSLALKTTNQVLSNSSETDAPLYAHAFGVINEFTRMTTPLSNPLSISKRVINPKQFDRVFNLMIDPFSFEIDVAKTTATPHGKQALELMIKHGDVVPTKSMSTLRFGSSVYGPPTSYVPRSRNTAEGDIVFEKYIVSIETVGEEQI